MPTKSLNPAKENLLAAITDLRDDVTELVCIILTDRGDMSADEFLKILNDEGYMTALVEKYTPRISKILEEIVWYDLHQIGAIPPKKYLVSGVMVSGSGAFKNRKFIMYQFATEEEREKFVKDVGLIEIRRSEF